MPVSRAGGNHHTLINKESASGIMDHARRSVLYSHLYNDQSKKSILTSQPQYANDFDLLSYISSITGQSFNRMAFDGCYIYVAVGSSATNTGKILQIDPVAMILVSSVNVQYSELIFGNVRDITFDGTYLYAAVSKSDATDPEKVFKYDTSLGLVSTGELTGITGADRSRCITCDGTNIYVGCSMGTGADNYSKIVKMLAADLSVLGTWTGSGLSPNRAINLSAMIHDGVYLYAVMDNINGRVFRILMSSMVGSKLTEMGSSLKSIAYDGTKLFVCGVDAGDMYIFDVTSGVYYNIAAQSDITGCPIIFDGKNIILACVIANEINLFKFDPSNIETTPIRWRSNEILDIAGAGGICFDGNSIFIAFHDNEESGSLPGLGKVYRVMIRDIDWTEQ